MAHLDRPKRLRNGVRHSLSGSAGELGLTVALRLV
jgi:hypothetical protein